LDGLHRREARVIGEVGGVDDPPRGDRAVDEAPAEATLVGGEGRSIEAHRVALLVALALAHHDEPAVRSRLGERGVEDALGHAGVVAPDDPLRELEQLRARVHASSDTSRGACTEAAPERSVP
jgi:hypothetical protein